MNPLLEDPSVDPSTPETPLPVEEGPFPPEFVWGAATSSHQVEGDNVHNDWWRWELADPSRIRGGRVSGRAAGWWAHGGAERDLALAARLGHRAHRLGLEWSRLEPERNRRDPRAVDRYREILGHARDLGLRTFVTLNHFTLPTWVADGGGWLSEETVEAFGRHCGRTVDELGDLVDGFFTINEPSVLALKAYVHGMWPPGRRQPRLGARALRLQLLGHAAAYRAIKRRSPDHPAGPALNLPDLEPARLRDARDRTMTRLQDWTVNGALLRALRTGWCHPPLGLRPRRHPELVDSFDFVGVNFYGRYRVHLALEPGRMFPRFVQENSIRTEGTDWGEPSPEGLVRSLRRAAELGKPVYVSENGIFTHDDEVRRRYLRDHVQALAEAYRQGLDLRGYFFWSLVDNFEWAQGWTTPFGLVAMDPDTQTRTVRPSARLYAEIVRRGGLPPEPAFG